MNPPTTAPPAAPPDTGTAAPRSWWTGRSELFVGLLVIGIGAFTAVQTAAMHVPDTSTGPGPRLFPSLVSGLMIVLGVLLAAQVVRRPAAPAGDAPADAADPVSAPAERSDWRAVGTVLGAVTAFTLLLQPVGWLLSGALLFFGVSRAFPGGRPLFEAGVALVYSAVVQLVFVAGLGLNLPSGILGGLL
ncbi:tripartite tricarboxylate transporter TctB family protein [Nocardiopsis coralliicola]